MTMPPVTATSYTDLLRRRGQQLAKMPEHDAVIVAMEPALRRMVGSTWERRAHEELKASMAFAVLARELLEVGAPPDAMARVARAVADEVRHAELLRALASRVLEEDVGWPPAVHVETTPLGANPRVTASLHAVALCCVNETIAGVFIEASRDVATSPSARIVLGLILADEVEHGRAGWAYLSSVRGERPVREAVQNQLGSIVQTVAACWFDDAAITLPKGAPEHGLLSNEDTHRCVVTALRDLVIPGFVQLGFDVSDAVDVVGTLTGGSLRRE
jgi:hypothetical protein